MTEDQFKALRVGDLVRHKLSGDAYVIVDEVRLIAVRAVNLTNPPEWNLVDRGGSVINGDAGLAAADPRMRLSARAIWSADARVGEAFDRSGP